MGTERVWCGEMRATHEGQGVTVYGWVDRRRDHGGLTFFDLRDRTGVVQIVVNADIAPELHEQLRPVRLEWVLCINGKVRRRSAESVNSKLPTGEVELHAEDCTILAAAKTLPFAVNEDAVVEELVRLQYRYLDLRRPLMQGALRQRARFYSGIRRAMEGMDFTEIETPTMTRAMPEGARDYLVPSRITPGHFYALAQSPQLYKQLCMVGGLERYYQIAHCWRDEDLRADRQPEFTQLDLEMSFVDEEDVFAVCETAIASAWKTADFHGTIRTPFPRLTWHDVMRRYGVDKPDVRFGMELCDLTDALRHCQFRVFTQVIDKGGEVKAITVPGGVDLTRTAIEEEWADVARAYGAKGLAYLWRHQNEWQGSIAKFFSDDELQAIGTTCNAAPGDAVLMVADEPSVVAAALGELRNQLARKRKMFDPDTMAMIWVTEFPMFERNIDGSGVSAMHHPFTMMHPDDLDLMESQPLSIRARAYDIVLNGRECGSGSIRITDPSIQQRVFRTLGISPEQAQQKFGFLLTAFEYGVPPHGGFAAGLDRLVMEGLGLDNIRDVIAFPKNQQAQEVMTNAPAEVDDKQLAEVGLQLRRPRKSE